MQGAITDDQEQTIDELTQQLTRLREENSRMGQVNQELSAKLKDATEYNQALGLDLYQLDQQISDIEDKYKENMNRAKELHLKTKEMKRRTDDYKNYLGMDSKTAAMAKKLQLLQEFRDQANLGLNELEKILSNDRFSELPYSFQNLEERIHFLFWYNHDLERTVKKVSKKIPEDQFEEQIDKGCGTPEQIHKTKEEWEKIKLYKVLSEQNSEAVQEEENKESNEQNEEAAQEENNEPNEQNEEGAKEENNEQNEEAGQGEENKESNEQNDDAN